MPTEAVWVIITIPRKEYEKELKNLKIQNARNNLNGIEPISASNSKPDISLEKILSDTLKELQIENVVWIPTHNGNHHQVYFPCELYENDSILQLFKSRGIGTKPETSIGFIPFNLFFYEEFSDSEGDDTFDDNDENLSVPPFEKTGKKLKLNKKSVNAFKEATQDFLKSVTSRLTVSQVVEGIRSGAEITFDFTVYTLMAAFIAVFGIVSNDPVNIAASMMIEPVMGTVMAMTFGLVIHDKKLFLLGLKNNIISLMMSLIPGFIIGLIFFIWMTEWNPPPSGIWPGPQMQGRGTYEGIIYGVMIALPCGGAVAVSLLNSNYGALVGVAVASTFQPPFVNTGLLWALSVHYQIRGLKQNTVPFNISGQIFNMKPAWAPQDGYSPVYSYDMRKECALLGCVSLALTGVNIVCMLIVAYITLKIKEVVPLNKMEPGTQRFFSRDLKIARQFNRISMDNGRANEPIGAQILREWAQITGIDPNQLLSSSPEARVTRLQTLYDIAKDVESDETYKKVMGYPNGNAPNNKPQLVRRLTQPYIYHERNGGDHRKENDNGIWNIEQEISRALDRRGFPMNRMDKHRHLDESDDEYVYSTIGSGRGYKPSQMVSEKGRRRSSRLLRKSLQQSKSSPYSIWPSGQRHNSHDYHSDSEDRVRRRNNNNNDNNYRMETQMDSTAF